MQRKGEPEILPFFLASAPCGGTYSISGRTYLAAAVLAITLVLEACAATMITPRNDDKAMECGSSTASAAEMESAYVFLRHDFLAIVHRAGTMSSRAVTSPIDALDIFAKYVESVELLRAGQQRCLRTKK